MNHSEADGKWFVGVAAVIVEVDAAKLLRNLWVVLRNTHDRAHLTPVGRLSERQGGHSWSLRSFLPPNAPRKP